MKTKLLFLALSLGAFSSASASVTIDVQAEVLKTSSGVAIPLDSRILVVADTSGNGFGTLQAGAAFAIDSLVAGTDDRIVGVFDMSVWGEAGVFQTPSFTPELSSVTGWTANDPLALIWLPTQTSADSALIGGAEYGIFFGPTGSGGDAWLTPTDGNPGSFFFFTSDASTLSSAGTFAPNSSYANLQVAAVPEPGRFLLSMLGLAMLVVRRRR